MLGAALGDIAGSIYEFKGSSYEILDFQAFSGNFDAFSLWEKVYVKKSFGVNIRRRPKRVAEGA